MLPLVGTAPLVFLTVLGHGPRVGLDIPPPPRFRSHSLGSPGVNPQVLVDGDLGIATGKLSPASAVEHASAFSVARTLARTPTPESLWSLPTLADLACLFALSEEWTDLPTSTASPAKLNPCSLLDGAFSTAWTHIPVHARDLTSEEKELRQSAREKELKKFEDYEVKESVPVEAVPPSTYRTAIPLL
uniref:Uncharacterized protein n=1 Tax=Chromera velia CCMP2878 TaxID=1169474 RepID=A0A0G4H9Y2_9ALVE|eukprot:Cvel_909.t1-p1 / transcript=Cvel_909.t1 / gene=Cvel_909 / organism=Chromera_velia_CCMP2878 / gene_product=hypothetical protein / transcript_product=hypothetical protein / location=Cvel_scaffold28:181265-183476(-) / protein_length=187 / sequence_SO=supercontig / SO=protein_coding / is_pseudo=false